MSFFKNTGCELKPLTYDEDGRVWNGDEWVTPSLNIRKEYQQQDKLLGSKEMYVSIESIKYLCKYKPDPGVIVYIPETRSTYISYMNSWIPFTQYL